MGKNVFATPLLDSTFKLVFGEKKHRQVTIDFLNDILERTGQKNEIKEISFMHQELGARQFDDKKSILDINCTDAQGNHFIIEIQRKHEAFFDWRLFYYAASLLSRQLQETQPYSRLTPVIIIGILNFRLYQDFDEPVSHHMMCDMRTGKQSIPLIELHIVELGKFNKKVDELITHIDKWLFFLKKAHEQINIPAAYDNTPTIRQAFHALERWNWKPERIAAYDKEVMAFQIELTQDLVDLQEKNHLNAQIQELKQGVEDALHQGLQEGLHQGLQEGLHQGLQEGLHQGLQEGLHQGALQKAEVIAIKMLKKNKSFDEIAEITELTIEQIQELKHQEKNRRK